MIPSRGCNKNKDLRAEYVCCVQGLVRRAMQGLEADEGGKKYGERSTRSSRATQAMEKLCIQF
jgi:hypothetical protein